MLGSGTSLSGLSSGLGEDKARLLPQREGAKPPDRGLDTGHLETVFCFYFNKSYHYTSSSHARVPKMFFS